MEDLYVALEKHRQWVVADGHTRGVRRPNLVFRLEAHTNIPDQHPHIFLDNFYDEIETHDHCALGTNVPAHHHYYY